MACGTVLVFDGGVITGIDGAESHLDGIDGVSFDFIALDRAFKGERMMCRHESSL